MVSSSWIVSALIHLSGYGKRQGDRETGSIADRSRSAWVFIHSHFCCLLHEFKFAHACVVDTDVVETGTVGSVNTTPKKSQPVAAQTSVAVVEEAGCDSFLPCDPRQWLHRYFMLVFMCMLSFGSYYVYDNPTALQRTIMNVSFLIWHYSSDKLEVYTHVHAWYMGKGGVSISSQSHDIHLLIWYCIFIWSHAQYNYVCQCYHVTLSLYPPSFSLTHSLTHAQHTLYFLLPLPPPPPLFLSFSLLSLQVMHVDNTQYTILYSIYSWPNVILSIFGGFLLDRVFGIRIGTIVFSALICIGQFVFALGGLVNKFWVMIFGRFIFGWAL